MTNFVLRQMKMKIRSTLISAVCIIVIVFGASLGSLSQTVSVAVDPSTYYVNVGDTASVVFRIYTVTNLHSASLLIKFNNTKIKFLSAIQGNFFPGGSFFGNQPSNNLVTDSVIIDQFILGPGSVSGSGLLFTVKFKALANGTSPVTIKYADLRDPSNYRISSNISSGLVVIGGINTNLKLFLEGPFNAGTGIMNTSLNTNGFLPLAQPYNQSPWMYNGGESVPLSFFSSHPDIVDWVLLEIRSGVDAFTVVARKAAFIRSNGTIVDFRTGNSSVVMDGLASGSYYVVVHYASHLSVMSSVAITLSSSSPLYDFTTGLGKFYGNDAKLISAGVYGSYAGDVDKNGLINSSDKNTVYNARGTFGYLLSDVDRNGLVNSADKNMTYNNRGLFTQVP